MTEMKAVRDLISELEDNKNHLWDFSQTIKTQNEKIQAQAERIAELEGVPPCPFSTPTWDNFPDRLRDDLDILQGVMDRLTKIQDATANPSCREDQESYQASTTLVDGLTLFFQDYVDTFDFESAVGNDGIKAESMDRETNTSDRDRI